METSSTPEEIIYHNLRRNYLIIYSLAVFVDWLQGPYLYRIYSDSNYARNEICYFYMTGFTSSGLFGIIVGYCADKFGRKKLCIMYFLSTILACVSTTARTKEILLIGRIFGGISTSILFSTFESWYICQHLSRHSLRQELIAVTFAKSTFYNGLIAILSGFVASFLVDTLEYGPAAPFFLSVPISIVAASLCTVLWTENIRVPVKSNLPSIFQGLRVITEDNRELKILWIVQVIFETAMYIFVFLWTPVLEPMDPSFGFVFGIFMICIVFGSFIHSTLANYLKIPIHGLLAFSVILALFSIITSTIGVHLQLEEKSLSIGSYVCLISFLFFELAVGIYFPAVSYLRSIIVPEHARASVANWLRLPCNILIVLILFYMRIGESDYRAIFALSAAGLSIAALYSMEFIKIHSRRDCPKQSQMLEA